MALFDRYVGIDYSGAQTPEASLSGLRIYLAEAANLPEEVPPGSGPKKYWTQRGIAQWLRDELSKDRPTIVGIDHGFSFPIAYFQKYSLPLEWAQFLDDFQQHWPTDEPSTCVDFIREGICGQGAKRMGDAHWLRLTEEWTATAKSVFLFDVQGSVAKSTLAGLPWLRYLRKQCSRRVHFWPFDSWQVSRWRLRCSGSVSVTLGTPFPKAKPGWRHASCLCCGSLAPAS